MLDGQRVEMAGIIDSKTSRATKQGQLMGIYVLEDLFGTTEVLAFPRVFEQVGGSLNEGDTAVLSGRLSSRDGKLPNLILDTFRPLKPDAERGTEEIQTKSNEAGKLFLKLKREQLGAVEFILETTPGAIRVYYYFEEEGKN